MKSLVESIYESSRTRFRNLFNPLLKFAGLYLVKRKDKTKEEI